jgi:hypothetical protein
MLYWAEGSKSRVAVQFVNSDPAMARYFVDFLRTYYGLPDEAFRVDCTFSPTTRSVNTRSSSSGLTRSDCPPRA